MDLYHFFKYVNSCKDGYVFVDSDTIDFDVFVASIELLV